MDTGRCVIGKECVEGAAIRVAAFFHWQGRIILMKSHRLERSLNLVSQWHKAEMGRKRDYIGTARLLTCDFESFIMVSSIFMHG